MWDIAICLHLVVPDQPACCKPISYFWVTSPIFHQTYFTWLSILFTASITIRQRILLNELFKSEEIWQDRAVYGNQVLINVKFSYSTAFHSRGMKTKLNWFSVFLSLCPISINKTCNKLSTLIRNLISVYESKIKSELQQMLSHLVAYLIKSELQQMLTHWVAYMYIHLANAFLFWFACLQI